MTEHNKSDMVGETGRREDDDEIEVTPEMIEAGISAFSGFNPEFEELGVRLERVFREMAFAIRE